MASGVLNGSLATFVRLIQFALGSVFLGSGVDKWLRIDQFAAVLRFVVGGRPIPDVVISAAAHAVAAFEIVLGIAFIVAWIPRAASAVAFCTLVVLSFVLLSLTLNPDAPPCQCTAWIQLTAGPSAQNGSIGIVRNCVMLLLAAFVWRYTAPQEPSLAAANASA